MKQKEVFKKIGGIIKELNDQYEYLQRATEDLNDLELELFVSNAHFLTDHIEILCKLNLQNKKGIKQPVEKQEVTYEKKFFEPVVQQIKPGSAIKEVKLLNDKVKTEREIIKQHEDQSVQQIDIGSETPEDTYSFVREEPGTIRHELVLDETAEMYDDEDLPLEDEFTIAEEEEEEETDKALPADKASVHVETVDLNGKNKPRSVNIDTEEEALTINEKMSSQLKDKAAAKTEQLNIKPISDIKLAITLNDKLLFVKDLFNGYNLAYSEAIEILNRFSTFEEASRFLKTNYVTKNNWESKPETTEKFYDLLKRRYT